MKLYLTFESFWVEYHERPVCERRIYFDGLSQGERSQLIDSFFKDGWAEVIVQNIIDERLDYVKEYYGIDLIELRIQALTLGKVFLVDKEVWEEIEDLMFEFDSYYDVNVLFGDLVISDWGRHKQFCKIRATRRC